MLLRESLHLFERLELGDDNSIMTGAAASLLRVFQLEVDSSQSSQLEMVSPRDATGKRQVLGRRRPAAEHSSCLRSRVRGEISQRGQAEFEADALKAILFRLSLSFSQAEPPPPSLSLTRPGGARSNSIGQRSDVATLELFVRLNSALRRGQSRRSRGRQSERADRLDY